MKDQLNDNLIKTNLVKKGPRY